MSTHVIKKTEYTSNVWFKVDNTIDESYFDHLFDMFEECTFTNVSDLTLKEFVDKLQKWECTYSNRKYKPSCINYGATLELMLPDEPSLEVMQQLCDRFINENFDGYPYYATYYYRGSAVCLFFWIFTRKYYEHEQVEHIYYKEDVYSNAKTGRICRKDDENAVLRHKKGEIKTERSTEFSLVKARFFSFTKKKFKEFRETLIENVIALFVVTMTTKVEREVTFPKCSLSAAHHQCELLNMICVINPKIKEIETEVNEIYTAMIQCELQDDLKQVFHKEIIQRIKNILRTKAFHRGNMKKSLRFRAEMNRKELEANMETLIDYSKELKTSFFKKYFAMGM